ncbi:hypothetical protein Q5X54_17525 [Acinetobacter baumannii]|nr:hypothetical protein [Acinetobacter baumannii]MDV7490047.1 hypothetical protein [Acinetobacter baumannii]
MKKQELIEKVTGWILGVTLYGTAVFYLVTKVLGITGDDLDAFVGLLGVGATLFGGYMAIYLFTDWREQKQFELEKEKLDKILEYLGQIHSDIVFLRSDIILLNKVSENFTYYPKIAEKRNPEIDQLLFNMFTEIKIYSVLAGNDELVDLYNILEKICFLVFGIQEDFVKKEYRGYLECIYKEKIEDKINLDGYNRNYRAEEKFKLGSYIVMLGLNLETQLKRRIADKDGNLILEESKIYLEYVEQVRDKVDEMMEYCAQKIKLN